MSKKESVHNFIPPEMIRLKDVYEHEDGEDYVAVIERNDGKVIEILIPKKDSPFDNELPEVRWKQVGLNFVTSGHYA